MGPHAADAQDAPADHPLVACFDAARDELLGTLAHLLGNRDDALDAAQEAFVKCWRARDTDAGVGNLRAWVFKVALNTARDMRKSAWSRRAKPLSAEDALVNTRDHPPGVALEHAEEVGRLRAAISGLRPDEQEVFLLRQNGELTYEQIAAQRQTPVGTVKTQMRSALIKLKLALAPAAAGVPAHDRV